ncbi:MAG: Rsd/AlgQ family anti-sigma factor [Methylicorpusculum sp.]|uniref:Rsd/AlgQ family anti-sigma factor n=1 Tax=Methylicorpusculum sp. TaxID=2713644 RepID=UPI00271C4EF2|nr:Rsd/AlgQ family anti-sigma factor [Methylicorpusculum sp.]MDO8843912.1 Rsd/AlgQ family anti-sigma factor [Methylicorpusculum sp.]MDO8940083.1 Rsd/AlgQ family anti-sigma factor [Methylicorpusculum sp.]MDO9239598.1 Rsd/AlgQ family anti-sigma factor [Methylicorpusculum sp.]MDP2178566.1 Rsd/AlgQ family anti-sigma factor [Methylicorpusculum sp.]MDP2203373.1 Rsd/AlgQ family anti-sigma factor [Methylicorpusculum sp.]
MISTPPNIDRRQQSRHLVDELKKERQEVWSMYCRVAELKPFSPQQKVQLKLTEFSQLLVDYISLGHFGIYDRLVTGDERRAGVLNVAEQIYPELSKTTDVAIAFNDKYEDALQALNLETLEHDLSHLGEHLAIRIDLEDKLCNMLLN